MTSLGQLEWRTDFGKFNFLGTLLITVIAALSAIADVFGDQVPLFYFVPPFLGLMLFCGGALLWLETKVADAGPTVIVQQLPQEDPAPRELPTGSSQSKRGSRQKRRSEGA